jgi:LacI family transcriptional regulator
MREPSHPLSTCTCTRFDSFACGRLAAEHFLERHYTSFAFVGEPHGLYWSVEREQGFKETLARAGRSCHVYGRLSEAEKRDWAVEQPRLQAWLRSLPKPIALFAAMDGRGRQVLDACMGAGIAVPDEVAVLGVDNDELICDATFPTMSSIQANNQQTGYLLAEHLDALMSGKRLRKRVIPTTPTRVVTRRSTDATVIADRQIARALEFIWRNAGRQPIRVSDVVREIGASRRFAERHFKTVAGRTILDEIRRVRLERVCTLLAETNLPIGEITRQCGFERESYLARLFKTHFGQPMSAYRTRARSPLA